VQRILGRFILWWAFRQLANEVVLQKIRNIDPNSNKRNFLIFLVKA
jgi:hypothetical protein